MSVEQGINLCTEPVIQALNQIPACGTTRKASQQLRRNRPGDNDNQTVDLIKTCAASSFVNLKSVQ